MQLSALGSEGSIVMGPTSEWFVRNDGYAFCISNPAFEDPPQQVIEALMLERQTGVRVKVRAEDILQQPQGADASPLPPTIIRKK